MAEVPAAIPGDVLEAARPVVDAAAEDPAAGVAEAPAAPAKSRSTRSRACVAFLGVFAFCLAFWTCVFFESVFMTCVDFKLVFTACIAFKLVFMSPSS